MQAGHPRADRRPTGWPRALVSTDAPVPSGEIVVLTGLGDDRDQRAALDAGAIAFLRKGIALEALAERLRDIAQGT